jgi:hypothetical protein
MHLSSDIVSEYDMIHFDQQRHAHDAHRSDQKELRYTHLRSMSCQCRSCDCPHLGEAYDEPVGTLGLLQVHEGVGEGPEQSHHQRAIHLDSEIAKPADKAFRALFSVFQSCVENNNSYGTVSVGLPVTG